MHLYKTIKSFLYDEDYFIDLWQNSIHCYGFIDIAELLENKIILIFEKFKLELSGESFRVLKLTKKEILIEGNILEMRFLK